MEKVSGQKRETFVVRVLYQQNNTWQGEVLWAERNERRYFRSALELMKMMDRAIEKDQEEDKSNHCGRNLCGVGSLRDCP